MGCVCECVFVCVYTDLQQIITALEVPHQITAVSIRRLLYEQPSHT